MASKKVALMPFIGDILESDESYSDESEDDTEQVLGHLATVERRKLPKLDLYFEEKVSEYFPDTLKNYF